MKKIVCYILYLAVSVTSASCAENDSLEVNVTVVDNAGHFVENARIQVGFQPQGFGGNGETGFTDANGLFSAKGRSNLHFSVSATKDGYYRSELKRQEVQKQVEPRKWKVVDHDVTMILRKIMSPIPMYGKRKSTVDVPDYGTPIGFDMVAGDWVRPYGQGETNDLIFLLSGHFNDFNDKDVTLTLSFSNPGDGIIVADPVPESEFTSPYVAPLTGYQDQKQWRLFRRPIGNDRIEQGNEAYDEREKIYLVRVRTLLDEDGNVEKAYYGKICDGILFEGNVGDGRYTSLNIESSYLNPTVNDRNLEYAVGENLVDNLKGSEQPKHP